MRFQLFVVLEGDGEEGDGDEIGKEIDDVLVDEGGHLGNEGIGIVGSRGKKIERFPLRPWDPLRVSNDEMLDGTMYEGS